MVQHACLACPDGRKKFSYCRGLCTGCYQRATRLVKEGKATWEALIEQGKALSSDKEATGQKNYARGYYGRVRRGD